MGEVEIFLAKGVYSFNAAVERSGYPTSILSGLYVITEENRKYENFLKALAHTYEHNHGVKIGPESIEVASFVFLPGSTFVENDYAGVAGVKAH